jgi:hypothetical protein
MVLIEVLMFSKALWMPNMVEANWSCSPTAEKVGNAENEGEKGKIMFDSKRAVIFRK